MNRIRLSVLSMVLALLCLATSMNCSSVSNVSVTSPTTVTSLLPGSYLLTTEVPVSKLSLLPCGELVVVYTWTPVTLTAETGGTRGRGVANGANTLDFLLAAGAVTAGRTAVSGTISGSAIDALAGNGSRIDFAAGTSGSSRIEGGLDSDHTASGTFTGPAAFVSGSTLRSYSCTSGSLSWTLAKQ